MRWRAVVGLAAMGIVGCGGDLGGGGDAPGAGLGATTAGAGGASTGGGGAATTGAGGGSTAAGGAGGGVGTTTDGGAPDDGDADAPDPDAGAGDAGDPDAGPVPCGCFAGPGTYCADAALARAVAEGCSLPKAKKHPGDVLSCHGGVWRWDATCVGACKGAGAGDDACAEVGYELPWSCGVDKTCTAANSEGWHHEGLTEYAFDFAFAVGNKVRAMRGGVVAHMRFDTKPGDPCWDGCEGDGCDVKCGGAANVLTVRHDDGTVAQYLHLSEPAPGLAEQDRVEQGQLLARSGNTGWSTGPHLHAMLMEKGCKKETCQSIPLAFHGIGKPKKGKSYTSKNCP